MAVVVAVRTLAGVVESAAAAEGGGGVVAVAVVVVIVVVVVVVVVVVAVVVVVVEVVAAVVVVVVEVVVEVVAAVVVVVVVVVVVARSPERGLVLACSWLSYMACGYFQGGLLSLGLSATDTCNLPEVAVSVRCTSSACSWMPYRRHSYRSLSVT